MQKQFFLLLLLVVVTLPVMALQTIKGTIVDGSTQKPIDFVNVALLKSEDAPPSTGVVTDEKGNFLLPNVPPGKYFLRVSFVGYNTISIPLNVNNNELNVGKIKLTENSKTLSEIQVVGQGTQMRFEIDKKVFSVDQNIAAAGGSATEVLQNIPSVDVDNEGNVSLRNNSSVEVWINGKPSGLTAENRAQILQQMPAESIESIEIMTNPSAKYNPEGTAGIINLVMKRNRKAGYYGSLSAGTIWNLGSTPGFNSGLNLNYSSGLVDAYINVGYRAMNFNGGGWTNRYNLTGTDTLSLLHQDSKSTRSFNGLFTRAGVNYRFHENHTLGLSGFGMMGGGSGSNDIQYKLTNLQNNNLLRDYYRLTEETGTRPGMNVTLDYKWDIDKLGSNLMSSLTYSAHQRSEVEEYFQKDRLVNDSGFISQTTNGNNREWEFKLDFTKKFTEKTRLEAGWQSSIEDRFGPSSAVDLLANQPLNAYFNEFDYSEQIHAGYLTFGSTLNKLTLQAGLRGEYFWRNPVNTVKLANGTEVTTDYGAKGEMQWFPGFFASYSLPDNNELQINLTRRVNRPRGRQINPFRDFSDSTNISYGNLELRPEYTTAFEFNYLKTWDNHSLSSTLYHRFTDDVIQGVSYINGPAMESTFMNVTQAQSTGMELVLKNNLFRILNLTSSLNFYYNVLEASTYTNPYNSSVVTTIPGQENFTWSGRIMGNVILGKNTFGQLTADYSAPRLLAQGKQTSSYSIDLGLRQTFLDRNLSLNLMVRDLLDSRRRSTVTWGNGFYQQSESYFHGRMLGMTVTYNFGNMKPKRSEQRRDDSGSMDMGMDD